MLISIIVPCAGADVVYSQAPTTDPALVGLGWYSTSQPRPTRNYKHADNFELTEDTRVSGVSWWGLTEGLNDTHLQNFDAFTIEFWTSMTLANGRIKPDALMTTQTFTVPETSALETGRVSPIGIVEYRHEVELGTEIFLESGTTYWISISARSIDPSGDVWQWQDAENADTISSSWDYNAQRWLYLEDSDSAFELVNVPAPSGASLVFAGVFVLSRRVR